MILRINLKTQLQSKFIQYKQLILIGSIIFLALIIRLGILAHTVDFHGVANGKILEAQMILNNPVDIKLWTPVHPPAHILFLIAGIKLLGSFTVGPRMISLGFGIMTILICYLYFKSVFNQETALFSSLAISLYSAHIVYSIIATSETSFHFFLFISLYVFELIKQKNNRYLLFLLGLSVGIASMCRYEGLLLIPFYMIFLRDNKFELMKFTVYALIIPVVWLVVNYLAFGNAFEFLASNNFIVPQQIDWIRTRGYNIDFVYKLLFWPKSLMQTLGVGVFSFGIIGVVYSAFRLQNKLFAALLVMFFSVFLLNTLQETLYFQPRYGITLGLILIPFSIYFFITVLEQISQRIPKWTVLILVWTMIIPIGEQVFAAPLYAPVFAKNTALYLENNANIKGNIIMDHCGDEKYREPIKVLSRVNPTRFALMPKKISNKGDYVIDQDRFFQMLEDDNIQTLVYSPYGELNKILNFNTQNNTEQRQSFLFALKFKSHPYYIYEIKKVKNDQ
jgi:Dolichyl-phosphate-mannose-protein mannosyltransferase